VNKIPVVVLLSCWLPACSVLPGFADPAVTFAPRLYLLKPTGKTAMQSAPPGLGRVDNPSIDLRTFGLRERNDDVGGQLAFGDGFSGIEVGYLQLDEKTFRTGVLPNDWGVLPQGTEVRPSLFLEEYEVAYFGELFQLGHEEETRLRLALGARIAHREGKFVAGEVGTDLSQTARFKDDGVPYVAGRARIERGGFALRGQYAWNPEFDFGGDFEPTLQDLEVTGSYSLENRGVTFVVGYRWSDLPISTHAGPFDYDLDLRIAGWVLGVEVVF
jgi:hypothetical protein